MTRAALPVLLFTHPGLGEGMLKAARAILGEVEGVDLLTNEGLSPEMLDARIHAWLEGHPGPALVLTDLSFGSCNQCARRAARGRDDVGIVAGVNLPMLLAVLRSRDTEGLTGLMTHLAERAVGSVETYLGGDRR